MFFAELIESAMYLYKATKDPVLLELGRDAIESIEKISKVDCGYATVSSLMMHCMTFLNDLYPRDGLGFTALNPVPHSLMEKLFFGLVLTFVFSLTLHFKQ